MKLKVNVSLIVSFINWILYLCIPFVLLAVYWLLSGFAFEYYDAIRIPPLWIFYVFYCIAITFSMSLFEIPDIISYGDKD